jgi:hypothetical protein
MTLPPFKKKVYGSRPLGDFLEHCLQDVPQQHGFTDAHLMICWHDIVGTELAQVCKPRRMIWTKARFWETDDAPVSTDLSQSSKFHKKSSSPPLRPAKTLQETGATLILFGHPAHLLELSYQKEVLRRRIQAYFGWNCVREIKIEPAPTNLIEQLFFAGNTPATALNVAYIPDQEIEENIERQTENITEPRLKAALTQLGTVILSQKK